MQANLVGPVTPKKILAVASGGGHWIQLYRMRPAWNGHHVTYASTMPDIRSDLARESRKQGKGPPPFVALPEANRWQKWRIIWVIIRVAILVIRVRPDFVVTTGAAHGYFAVRFGRLIGAKTIWIDSLANADELSMSAVLARPFADVWLTQWEHLARPDGRPDFHGAVM
jgi:hypothetical protein